MKDTMKILGLKKNNSIVILPNNQYFMGMIKKIEGLVAWGEISEDNQKIFKPGPKSSVGLCPPRNSLKKRRYPNGDLGYCGEAINKLIERMKYNGETKWQ